jgi:hypothetical protein
VPEINESKEVARDLAFMETLRRMRAQFHAKVVEAARTQEADAIAALRQDSLLQLAEFLYAVRTHGIDSAEKLERLALLHNEHLKQIEKDEDRMQRFGLTRARIRSALFAKNQLQKLLANFSGPAPGIDQSDLARLLATVMSIETCRKLVVAADKAGFVDRVRSPFGAVLVVSHGIVEQIYGDVVREARHEVMCA